MPLSPVGGVSAVAPLPTSAPERTQPTSGAFGASLTGALEELQALHGTADALAVRAVTGDLTDIHQATLAATRAQVTLELVATMRNKGVDAFNEIMRMQA